MKKVILSIVALMGLVILPMGVFAQTSSQVTAVTTGAKLIAPINLSSSGAALNFGTIIKSGTLDSIRVTPGNVRSALVMGSGSLLTSEGSTVPSFTVTGEATYTYNITLPSTATLTRTAGGTLTAFGFASNADLEIEGDGSNNFNVGATLIVPAAVVTGEYAGTFDVTVAYD